jgi:hypothetical protein
MDSSKHYLKKQDSITYRYQQNIKVTKTLQWSDITQHKTKNITGRESLLGRTEGEITFNGTMLSP